jgi:dTDP-4-amino-4,6-dideoxygalactose transaminase
VPAFDKPLHVERPNMGDRGQFLDRVGEIFDRMWFSNDGPVVREFEQRVAELLGVRHCVAVSNGTVGLEIAVRALGLTGEVIVPSYTFVATAHALHWQGITPVFADIDATTHNLDPDAVRRMITPRTSGILGVHLWGRPAPVEQLEAVASEHGLALLFDAAHAFGNSHGGRMIGSFGRAEVFSFHATKFFNTFEGGAVVTDDDDLAETVRLMRNFGFAGYDRVVHAGTNGKMIEVCAAMGLTNLDAIEETIAVNRRNHAAYRSGLTGVPGIHLLEYDESERQNYQYVVIEVDGDGPGARDRLVEALQAENVLARRYFWPGCHRMQPYADLFPQAGRLLPVTEAVADRVVVLPTGTAVTPDDIDIVTSLIRDRSAS